MKTIALPVAAKAARGRKVVHDKYSLTVNGQRVVLWSGEFPYFRLPSPRLWRDVLEKIRAAGFNCVTLSFHREYHSLAPGVYDFTGVRDVERLLRLTEELGLYVVARPAAHREWLSRINPILARHQVTRGGSVIACDVERAWADEFDVPIVRDVDLNDAGDKPAIIGGGATMFGCSTLYNGTSWGWLPQPGDHDAAITESRGLTATYDDFKRLGYFLTTVEPIAKTDSVPAPQPADAAVFTQARANPDTGTQFVLVRHADQKISTVLDWSTPDGSYAVPVRVNGRDAKILVAGYDLGGQRLVWSNSEILTHVEVQGRDVAVLYGREGEQGSTVLRYSSAPQVRVLDGAVQSSFDGKDLRLDYTHSGLARVLVSGGGCPPMLLMLGTDQTAAQFWRLDTESGPVLVRGTSLARAATVAGDWLVLKVDMDQAGEVETFAPARRLVVDGKLVATRPTPSGSLVGRLAGPRPVMAPALSSWQYRAEPPAFGDSGWTVADEPGHHQGNVWYRGTFTVSGDEKTLSVNEITGERADYLVWLNGHYLGSAPGRAFAIPDGLLVKGSKARLAVLVTTMGRGWTADDTRHKLLGVTVGDAKISWQIRGASNNDAERGPLNTGGLYGERAGWHLPFGQSRWSPAPSTMPAGVSWYRCSFRLDLPADQDVPMALRFGDQPDRKYRAFVFVNGWNMGQDIPGAPLRDFVVPVGVLGRSNTVVLAVIATEPDALAPVSLVTLGNRWTGAATVDQVTLR